MVKEPEGPFELAIILGYRVDLASDRERNGGPSLDRRDDARLHLGRGPAVAGADLAAVLALLSSAVPAAGMAHQLINHPGGDAGVLQPGRVGVPKVVRASEAEAVAQVVAFRWGAGCPTRGVALVFSGQSGGLEGVEGVLYGRSPYQSAARWAWSSWAAIRAPL